MHYVYLLQSLKSKKLHIGCISDLYKRIKQHNQGDSEFTKDYRPWRLRYFEGYFSKVDAFKREHSLKLHAQGLRRLKERLSYSLQA